MFPVNIQNSIVTIILSNVLPASATVNTPPDNARNPAQAISHPPACIGSRKVIYQLTKLYINMNGKIYK